MDKQIEDDDDDAQLGNAMILSYEFLHRVDGMQAHEIIFALVMAIVKVHVAVGLDLEQTQTTMKNMYEDMLSAEKNEIH